MGRAIAVEEVTEWICRHCGYDMGHGFIECEDADDYKRDKNSHPYITCPECDTTFDPALQSSYFKTTFPRFNRLLKIKSLLNTELVQLAQPI